MKHVYDINLNANVGELDEEVGKLMSRLTKTFQEISGSKDQIVLGLPITLKLTTLLKLNEEQIGQVSTIVRDIIGKSEFTLLNVKYVGVTN